MTLAPYTTQVRNQSTLSAKVRELIFFESPRIVASVAIALFLYLWPAVVGADTPDRSILFQNGRCTVVSTTLPGLERKRASASLYSHFVGGDGLFEVTEELIDRALKKIRDVPGHALCLGNKQPIIEFFALPNLVEDSEETRAECGELLLSTEKAPMTWDHVAAEEDESFGDLFLSFSRGRSTAGEELYERCPGSCSPNYRVFIPLKNEQPVGVVDVEVVCGLPRDTSDDEYDVSVRVSCPCDT